MKSKRRPAIFLDRDGTLISDAEYLHHPAQVRLYSNTPKALRLLRKAGYYLFVVTNQSGVARGYFPESVVKKVHGRLQQMLRAKGARIDHFFYCPHYPQGKVAKYTKACDCRKPAPGMVRQAFRKYPIDLKRSYVVGDKMDDLLLARNAKLAGGVLVCTGDGRKSEKQLKAKPLSKSRVVPDILGAAKWILEKG